MSRSDLLADMLTRVRNGQKARHAFVTAPSSKLVKNVVAVMLEEGYIEAYEEFSEKAGAHMLKIDLKYHKGLPVIEEIARISRSGRRVYSSLQDLKLMYGGLGTVIVSTSCGVMSDSSARKAGVGGEVLCEVFQVKESFEMSRIGKLPISVDKSVQVTLSDHFLRIEGKNGVLSMQLTEHVQISYKENIIIVQPVDKENRKSRAMWGLSRTLISNMVKGVSEGWFEHLEMTGVGYKASVLDGMLILSLGYSHEVMYAIPSGIVIKCERPTSISIFGVDKCLVGQVAAEIRQLRKPEPYKGKGIRRVSEKIRRKENKKK